MVEFVVSRTQRGLQKVVSFLGMGCAKYNNVSFTLQGMS